MASKNRTWNPLDGVLICLRHSASAWDVPILHFLAAEPGGGETRDVRELIAHGVPQFSYTADCGMCCKL